MKKITLSLIVFLFIAWSVDAKIRTQTEARELAGDFLQKSKSSQMKAPSAINRIELSYLCSVNESKNATNDLPLYYVYNIGENAGFVIVSADERANPILGYADSGSFNINYIPENFRNWLNFYAKELTMLSQKPETGMNKIPKTLQKNDKTEKAPKITNAGVAPLLGGVKWNQNSPYNDMCPLLPPANVTRAATGCVATAMAQIMKYYQWPVTGTGSNAYTTTTLGIPVNVNFSATTYDWANMTDTYTSTSTQVEKDAVATLMYHCGAATNMDYNTESGTSINAAAYALKNYFGYDANLQLNMRDFYTRAEWIALLKSEIDASRPVLYSGSSQTGGHAFVCDGYDNDDYFHFNWGWGGLSNGFFAITALNPGDVGIGGGDGKGYNSNQSILKGIQKPDPASVESFVLYTDSLLKSSVETTTRHGNFDITLTEFYNFGVNTFSGSIGLALYNSSGLVQIIDQGNVTLDSYYGWGELTFTNLNIPGSVANGIYKLYAIYKGSTETDWQIVRGRVGTPNYLIVNTTNSNIQFSNDDAAFPNLTRNAFSVTGNLYQNKTGRFNITLTNTGGEYNSGLILYLQSTSNPSVNQQFDFTPLNIATNETVNKQYYGTINVPPGEYYLTSYIDLFNTVNNPDTYILKGDPIIVNVLAEPTGDPAISMTGVMSFPNNASVPKNNAVLSAEIRNTNNYYEGSMIAFIFPVGGGSSLGYIGYQNVIIDAGETIPVSFRGSIDLPLGNYWIAAYYRINNSWQLISPQAYSLIEFTLAPELWTDNKNINNNLPTFFPNPVKDKLIVNITEKTSVLNVMDISGRKFISFKNPALGITEINASILESGIYILQLVNEDSKIMNLKFIKK